MVPTVEQCAKAIDLNCEYCCHVIINPKSFSKTSTRKWMNESLNRNFHHGEILRESMQCRVRLPCLCLCNLNKILTAVVVGFKNTIPVMCHD